MTLKDLRARAKTIGIRIDAERFDVSLSDGLAALEIERAAAIPKWTAQQKADLAALAAGKSVPVRWRVF